MVLPDTVDCDSAYQWVRAVGDLSCVRKSTPYGRLVFGLCQRQIGKTSRSGQDKNFGWLDFLLTLFGVTAKHDLAFGDRFDVVAYRHDHSAEWFGFPQFGDFGFLGLELFVQRTIVHSQVARDVVDGVDHGIGEQQRLLFFRSFGDWRRDSFGDCFALRFWDIR